MKHTFQVTVISESSLISKLVMRRHVKTAIERWGGAGHPSGEFFPTKIKVKVGKIIQEELT